MYNNIDKRTRLPEDLSKPAIKLARRLQSLPNGQTYVLVLTKFTKAKWLWALVGEAQIEEPE